MAAFSEMFKAAPGSCAYPYQTKFATRDDLSALVSVPTGCGKRAAVVLGWILSFGGEVQVVQPEALQRSVRAEARSIFRGTIG